MSIIQNAEKYKNRIAGDIVTVGGTVGALIAVVVNVAPSVHIPAGATASLVGLSAIIATVVQQARRVQRAKVAARKAALAERVAEANKAAEAQAAKAAKKAPAKKAAAKKATTTK